MSSLNSEVKEALDNFDVENARVLLRDALKDPNAETYYLASRAALDDDQKKEFLKRAVELDPFHEKARNTLKSISVDSTVQSNMPNQTSQSLEQEQVNKIQFATQSSRSVQQLSDSLLIIPVEEYSTEEHRVWDIVDPNKQIDTRSYLGIGAAGWALAAVLIVIHPLLGLVSGVIIGVTIFLSVKYLVPIYSGTVGLSLVFQWLIGMAIVVPGFTSAFQYGADSVEMGAVIFTLIIASIMALVWTGPILKHANKGDARAVKTKVEGLAGNLLLISTIWIFANFLIVSLTAAITKTLGEETSWELGQFNLMSFLILAVVGAIVGAVGNQVMLSQLRDMWRKMKKSFSIRQDDGSS